LRPRGKNLLQKINVCFTPGAEAAVLRHFQARMRSGDYAIPADPKHAALPKERVKAPAEAVKEAEVMVIATPWSAAEAAISKRRIGEDKLGVEVFLLWLIGLPFQRASLSDPVHCSKVVS
jgi:hypothetical protein